MTDLRNARMSRVQFFRMMGGLAVAAAATACSTRPDTAATTGGQSATTELKFVGVADQKAPMDSLLAAYQQAKPSVRINASFAPTDQVQTSVRTQLGAGNSPDLHVVYPGSGSAMSMTQIGQAGLLADLSAQPWTQTIPAGFKPAFQLDGKTYIYSAGSSVIGAIYNKKAFEKAKVAAPPTTWTEFLAVCDKLKKAGITPIALGAQTPWVTQLITYALVPSTVYAKDPTFDDKQLAGQATFADSGWRQAMEMYLELQKRGFFNDKPNGTTFEQQISMVATGKAAMAIQVSAVLPDFRKAASAAGRPVDVPRAGGRRRRFGVDPGRRRRRAGRQRQGQERRGGEGVHRLPRQAGEHQRLGQGHRRHPAHPGRELDHRPGACSRSCRSPRTGRCRSWTSAGPTPRSSRCTSRSCRSCSRARPRSTRR